MENNSEIFENKIVDWFEELIPQNGGLLDNIYYFVTEMWESIMSQRSNALKLQHQIGLSITIWIHFVIMTNAHTLEVKRCVNWPCNWFFQVWCLLHCSRSVSDQDIYQDKIFSLWEQVTFCCQKIWGADSADRWSHQIQSQTHFPVDENDE